jgi:hypothetical protein
MHVQEFINHFDNVKETGNGQYSCRCPSHKDRSNSLGIKQDGERILLNCFAGCSVKSILDAVNLKWSDILPANEFDYEIKKTFNPYSVLKMLRDEVLLVGLCSAHIRKGKSLNDADHKRLLKAISNIREAYGLCK